MTRGKLARQLREMSESIAVRGSTYVTAGEVTAYRASLAAAQQRAKAQVLDVGALKADLERVAAIGATQHVGMVRLRGREYYLVPKDGGGYACVPARPGSAR